MMPSMRTKLISAPPLAGTALLTLNEAAESLGLDPSTLRHQLRNGQLRGRKIGPVWTVTPEEVARYRMLSLGQGGRRAKSPTA